jgi:hypothetical protein
MQKFAGLRSSLVALAWAVPVAAAQAAEGYVRILAPADGAKLDGMEVARIAYEVSTGPKGDHVHVYVNGNEVGILRALKGSYALGQLPLGPGTVCVKVVNKAHVPIGIEQCIKVTVE